MAIEVAPARLSVEAQHGRPAALVEVVHAELATTAVVHRRVVGWKVEPREVDEALLRCSQRLHDRLQVVAYNVLEQLALRAGDVSTLATMTSDTPPEPDAISSPEDLARCCKAGPTTR